MGIDLFYISLIGGADSLAKQMDRGYRAKARAEHGETHPPYIRLP
jgi:hypothetical protein